MKITIFCRNDDSEDLFLSVWDLLSADQALVIDRQRLNPNEKIEIQVEGDEDQEARISWAAQRADDSGLTKEVSEVGVEARETVGIDFSGNRRVVPIAVEKLLAKQFVADPTSIAVVESLVRKTALSGQDEVRLVGIEQIILQWGQASVDTGNMKILPVKVEQRIVEFVNDTDEAKPHEELIRVVTKRSETLETSQKLTVAHEFKIGISFGFDSVGKLNTDILQKNQFEISTSQSQTFSEEVTIETKEKWTIPPRMTHHLSTLVAKGLLIAPVQGVLVIDALLRLKSKLGNLEVSAWLSNEKLLPNPKDRQVVYNGSLMSENYQKMTVRHRDVPVDEGHRRVAAVLDRGGWVSSG